MRSPEWPQRGRFSQFQQHVCDVKPFTAAEALENSEDPQTQRPVKSEKIPMSDKAKALATIEAVLAASSEKP
jgi:hypothetical protein